MAAAGAEEIFMPTLIPLDLFKQTGRDEAYGDNLFRVTDRHGRDVALGPTHEEVVTELFGAYVESYKDLPKTLYQIQTKFRDEFRPRFGVLRSREFIMKDAYSFHLDVEGGEGSGSLNEVYDKQYAAYERIFTRCGLPYLVVEAEAGPIGGSASHEFMVPSPTGEDTILTNRDDGGDYAANVEKCEIGPRESDQTADPLGGLETIHTPDCSTIEDVCAFFKKSQGSKLATKNMLKSLVYVATKESDDADPRKAKEPWYLLAIVRGDQEVNEGKLKDAAAELLGEPYRIEMAPDDLARQDGWAIGFVGPHAAVGRADTKLIVDHDAAQGGFWVTGANEVDHHVKLFNWKRDVIDAGANVEVRDIRNAVDGDPAPESRGGGTLRAQKGIEVGHVFKLGCKYTDAMKVTVTNEDNQPAQVFMGCYGIGVNRILASAIERDGGHDANGIVWPRNIAPWDVVITPIKFQGAAKEAACGLAQSLEQQGYAVLIDDRDERPGPKFKDADLIGIPLRITVGDKGLAQDPPAVELKARNGSNGEKGELVPLDQAIPRAMELLATL